MRSRDSALPTLLDGPSPFYETERVPREPVELLTRVALTSGAF
jgi:hypothetical protein